MHNYAEHASREYLFFVHKILLMKIRSFFGGYAKPLRVSVMWSFVICLRLPVLPESLFRGVIWAFPHRGKAFVVTRESPCEIAERSVL